MCFHLSPIFHNVLNKINIISAAADFWGINVSDEYFACSRAGTFWRCDFIYLARFSFMRKKNRKTNRQTVQIKLQEKKGKEKRKKKNGKKEKEKGKTKKEKEK